MNRFILFLILVVGCITYYDPFLLYDEASWHGGFLKYPEQVLGGPAIYDPLQILDRKQKESLEESLQEH